MLGGEAIEPYGVALHGWVRVLGRGYESDSDSVSAMG